MPLINSHPVIREKECIFIEHVNGKIMSVINTVNPHWLMMSYGRMSLVIWVATPADTVPLIVLNQILQYGPCSRRGWSLALML